MTALPGTTLKNNQIQLNLYKPNMEHYELAVAGKVFALPAYGHMAHKWYSPNENAVAVDSHAVIMRDIIYEKDFYDDFDVHTEEEFRASVYSNGDIVFRFFGYTLRIDYAAAFTQPDFKDHLLGYLSFCLPADWYVQRFDDDVDAYERLMNIHSFARVYTIINVDDNIVPNNMSFAMALANMSVTMCIDDDEDNDSEKEENRNDSDGSSCTTSTGIATPRIECSDPFIEINPELLNPRDVYVNPKSNCVDNFDDVVVNVVDEISMPPISITEKFFSRTIDIYTTPAIVKDIEELFIDCGVGYIKTPDKFQFSIRALLDKVFDIYDDDVSVFDRMFRIYFDSSHFLNRLISKIYRSIDLFYYDAALVNYKHSSHGGRVFIKDCDNTEFYFNDKNNLIDVPNIGYRPTGIYTHSGTTYVGRLSAEMISRFDYCYLLLFSRSQHNNIRNVNGPCPMVSISHLSRLVGTYTVQSDYRLHLCRFIHDDEVYYHLQRHEPVDGSAFFFGSAQQCIDRLRECLISDSDGCDRHSGLSYEEAQRLSLMTSVRRYSPEYYRHKIYRMFITYYWSVGNERQAKNFIDTYRINTNYAFINYNEYLELKSYSEYHYVYCGMHAYYPLINEGYFRRLHRFFGFCLNAINFSYCTRQSEFYINNIYFQDHPQAKTWYENILGQRDFLRYVIDDDCYRKFVLTHDFSDFITMRFSDVDSVRIASRFRLQQQFLRNQFNCFGI